MKIIFLTRLYLPHIGGVERHVAEVSRSLVSKKNQVIIFTEQFDVGLPLHENGEIEVYRIPLNKDDFFKKFRIWWYLFQHRKQILSADIVHCHDVFFWYLPFRFLFPWKRVFTTFHGYEGVYPPSRKSKVVRKLSEKLSYGNICVGEFIRKWYGTKANFVTYGGVKQDQKPKLKARKSSSKINIVFVGRIEVDTGVTIYVRVLQKMKELKINFNFSAFGKGDLTHEFEKFGLVELSKEITSELQKADIVFASSYLSILEALSLGKLVVSVYDNPLKKDYLLMSPFKSYIIMGDKPEEVAEKLQTALQKPDSVQSMIQDAYTWSCKQTWERVRDLYLKLWGAAV